MKTYGTLKLDGDRWRIECEPHVALRLKRIFGKVSRGARGSIEISATEENSRDLEWFAQRYPLDVADPDALDRLARAYDRKREHVTRILNGSFGFGNLPMALPPRDYQRIAAELAKTTGGLLLADEVGIGKAQPLSARVLTHTGWRAMGSLRVGDLVVDPDGGVAPVTGVFPQGEREVFRVTTSDGASAECCDDHLWLVHTANDRWRGGSRVLPLAEIRPKLHRHSCGNRIARWFLPLCAPIEFESAGDLPIDPYLLGLLLGDGCMKLKTIGFSNVDQEILSAVDALLPAGVTRKPGGGADYRLSKRPGAPVNPLHRAITKLGLRGHRAWEKFIPERYMRAAPPMRVALLQGLMDTDGDVTKFASTFNTTSQKLADQIVEIVRGLGGIASHTSRIPTYVYDGERRTGRRAYRVNVRVSFCPFRIIRKSTRWKPSILARSILRVEAIGTQPVRCIRVATKRSLYVTDGYLVTHNTVAAITLFADPLLLPAIVIVPPHLQRQWKAEIERFLPFAYVHIVKRGTPYETAHRGRNPDVLLLTYHKLHGWADHAAGHFKTVVFDECQELRRRKDPKGFTRRWAAAERLSATCRVRLGLSATPIYNYGDEFWNVCEILSPATLGTHEEFLREWCVALYGGKHPIRSPKVFGSYMKDSGLMLRRTRKDVGRELPALSRIVQEVESGSVALAADTTELAKLILGEGRGFDKMQASAEFDMRLRMATGVAKAPYVAAFVRMLLDQGPVVLFGWHRLVYECWSKLLEDLNPAWYTGTESPSQKATEIERFTSGQTKLLIMSLRAGSGVDGLQKVASQVVVGELDWSPGVHEQCLGRLHRDGQGDPVMAYFLVSDQGADPVMVDVLDLKRSQLEGVTEPDGALSQAASVDPDHIKKLAKAYLGRRSEPGEGAA